MLLQQKRLHCSFCKFITNWFDLDKLHLHLPINFKAKKVRNSLSGLGLMAARNSIIK